MVFVAFLLLQLFVVVKLVGYEEEVPVVEGGVVAGAVPIRLVLRARARRTVGELLPDLLISQGTHLKQRKLK